MVVAPKPIRVLVVDDSPFMRRAISRMLNADDSLEVVGTAEDGVECIEKVRELKPDVITLDVMMPRMDGMAVLKTLMEEKPVPVVMLSSLTTEGAETSLMALELGAVDIVDKPATFTNMDVFRVGPELIEKVKAAAGVASSTLARMAHDTEDRSVQPAPARISTAPAASYDIDAIIIGASTGGPPALQRIVAQLAPTLRLPIAIVQHMPPGFTLALAERLARICAAPVKEAEDGDLFEGGRVLVAKSGQQMHFERRRGMVIVRLDRSPAETPHMPSVDVALRSAADVFAERALGVLLTGMGADGAEGLLALSRAGAPTIAEAESSAVIFGMPRVAISMGAAREVLDLHEVCLRIGDISTR